jgi:hypothetical protein
MTDGNGLGQEERDLLARITLQIDRCSTYQHQLSKRGKVLREAATDLRLGRKVQAVLARIQEQVPDAVRVMESLTE